MTPFEFLLPYSLDEALSLLDPEDPNVRPVGGGTAVMLMMKAGVLRPTRLVSLQRIGAQHARIERRTDGTLVIGGLARLALADSLAQQDKTDEARKEYEQLIQHPDAAVPKERAQLQLARMLAESDPEAAKPLLEELMAQPGPVSVAAGTTLRQIQGS